MVDTRFEEKRFNFGKNNVILIGEASGLFTVIGEGIAPALFSGKTAAISILDVIDKNEYAINLYLNKIKKEKQYVLNTWKFYRKQKG